MKACGIKTEIEKFKLIGHSFSTSVADQMIRLLEQGPFIAGKYF
jgi:hypothetical protein